jgi:hypothetical protein
VQEEADKQVREEERRKSLERGEDGGGESTTPKGSPQPEGDEEKIEGEDGGKQKEKGAWGKEQMRKHIREDVDELVKGASFALFRL